MQHAYSQDNPSPRYRALVQQYQALHSQGSPDQGIVASDMFPGQSLLEHVAPLVQVVADYSVESMLDYGCGKAMLYRPNNDIAFGDGRRFSCLQDLLGVLVTLYDPAYLPYSIRPTGKFDLVVCTDVLEHCSDEDVPWIVEDLFGHCDRFLYANIACYPAKKTLPNGENAHCTIANVDWWQNIISDVAKQYPNVNYRFLCTKADGAQDMISGPVTMAGQSAGHIGL